MIQVEFHGEEKKFSAEEISSMILVKMKEIAEAYLGKEVKNAVVTSPPTSTTPSARRPRTPPSSPASIACASSTSPPRRHRLRPRQEVRQRRRRAQRAHLRPRRRYLRRLPPHHLGAIFEVKATAGDTHLGGDDFDQRLMN